MGGGGCKDGGGKTPKGDGDVDDDGKNEDVGVVALLPPIVAAFLEDDDDEALRDLLIDSIDVGIRSPTLDGDDVTLLLLSAIDDD